MADRRKAHFFGNAVAQFHHIVIAKSQKLSAFDIQEMIVAGPIAHIIVIALPAGAKQHRLEQLRRDQVFERAVHGGPAGAAIHLAQQQQQLFRFKGPGQAPGAVQNGLPFGGVF